MEERIKQFQNPSSSEFIEKPNSTLSESQAVSEKDFFTKAVETIKINERALRLLTLVERGYFPNQEDLYALNVDHFVESLRKKYPIIEDMQTDLCEVVDEQIGVFFQKGWTQEQYNQIVQEKKVQYKREAVSGIINALGPIYEKFGATSSEENKIRIFGNLATSIRKADPHTISATQRDYVKKNILSAMNQEFTPDEARRIIQIKETFFEIWKQAFPESADSDIENAVKRIKEKSGLALEELQEEIGTSGKEILSERFNLKGSEKEIEYSGIPIDVYLANKYLQIIDVRNDLRWNADYLLIDPATFDQENPRMGYKGIRKNEPFTIGRNNAFRFQFPDTVSRAHLRIELRDEKLLIEDVGSMNGTTLQVERPRRLNKEQIEIQKSSSEKELAIEKFFEFTKKHELEIERDLQQGRDLDELFYHDFYNKNIDNPRYKENDATVQRWAWEYSTQIKKMRENLKEESQKGKGVMIGDNGYWLYCNVNGGFRNQSSLGRLYFNLKPEYVKQIFSKTVEAFHESGLHSQMKIPLYGNAKAFNRFDKMVIYFDAEEEQKVLQILENLHKNNIEGFDETGVPRFTVEVKNQRNEKMLGVGFAEEPLFRNESFGTIRTKILAEVFMEARNFRHAMTDPNFNFDSVFSRVCLKYQVDPQNPAFNFRKDYGFFPEIKRRMSLKK
ncbi:MAG: FHA domain-containing protein [Candidatus Moraniibacteriota bacterium]|nr:MAG: FHA domain-containing protein [Candidatus Moranbacteria bacterium]